VATLKIVVNIDVDDLEKAIEFYTAALGLRVGRRLFGDSVAEMLGATSTIYLLLKPSGSIAAPNRMLSRDWPAPSLRATAPLEQAAGAFLWPLWPNFASLRYRVAVHIHRGVSAHRHRLEAVDDKSDRL